MFCFRYTSTTAAPHKKNNQIEIEITDYTHFNPTIIRIDQWQCTHWERSTRWAHHGCWLIFHLQALPLSRLVRSFAGSPGNTSGSVGRTQSFKNDQNNRQNGVGQRYWCILHNNTCQCPLKHLARKGGHMDIWPLWTCDIVDGCATLHTHEYCVSGAIARQCAKDCHSSK